MITQYSAWWRKEVVASSYVGVKWEKFLEPNPLGTAPPNHGLPQLIPAGLIGIPAGLYGRAKSVLSLALLLFNFADDMGIVIDGWTEIGNILYCNPAPCSRSK